MKELDEEEEHWLEVFAKNNPFFDDLLRYYLKNGFLTEKQYECLETDIDKAENDGKYILDKIDYRLLRKYAEDDDNLREILENYDEDGFLDEFDFNVFIETKLDLNPMASSIKVNNTRSSKKTEKYPKSINIKICPHCSFRCPVQLNFCPKCGEPLLYT